MIKCACWRNVSKKRIFSPLCGRSPPRQALSQVLPRTKLSQTEQYRQSSTHGKPTLPNLNVLDVLESRLLLQSVAGPRDELKKVLANGPVGVYCGVDPTADSMHIGNLLPLMVLFWLYHFGHRTITLVGGGTARIGDPSFREAARDSKTDSEFKGNTEKMKTQMIDLWQKISNLHLTGSEGEGNTRGLWKQLDNADWLDTLSFLDFMSAMGKGIRVSDLLSKDSMKTRLYAGQDKDTKGGLSLSELNYSSLQAWDFWQLYLKHRVQLQIGGGDQYGNITTGVDAVQYMLKIGNAKAESNPLKRSYGITTPLVTIGSKKMGKSEGNALFLSPDITSNFDLYQYFLRLPDDDVEKFYKMYTFTPIAKIKEIMKQHSQAPKKRIAHHALAHDFVTIHRGKTAAELTRREHDLLFVPSHRHESTSQADRPDQQQNEEQVKDASKLPCSPYPASLAFGTTVTDILVDVGMCKSKSEVNRIVTQGGIYHSINFKPIVDGKLRFRPSDQAQNEAQSDKDIAINDSTIVLRRGKWKMKVLKIVRDDEYDRLDSSEWSPTWKSRRDC